ncbi:hypothetical protein COOONC_18578 [Cooperia oncophora]
MSSTVEGSTQLRSTVEFVVLLYRRLKKAGFTKWAPGHPDSRAGECVYMEYNGMKSAWFSDDCDNDHNYICQATPCDSTKYCAAG